ncbi:hypothetical protein BGZ95_000611 [Linnemannia exigua]|uniref:F-box domain-containing protein n=1 Tax=Linnemannia exigua TaxID=604196 RepID=A0AAD4H4B3_9FUNG|nr:hypothetical protein BGZ95_000611 [Linnemannia exigua]
MGCHPLPLPKTDQHNNPHPQPTSGRTPSHLFQIPELLRLIFSNVDQYTITNTVIFVCRQWLLLSQDRLLREVIWDANWKPCRPGQALKRLLGADRLVIRYSHFRHIPLRPDVHTALQDVQDPPERWGTLPSAKLSQRQQQQQRPGRLRLENTSAIMTAFDRPLRKLVLITADKIRDHWKDKLPLPPTLTSITMHSVHTNFIDAGRILAICPVLETLHLSAIDTVRLRGPWTDRGLDAFPNHHLPLRSLILRNFEICRSWVEALLLITPGLEELQLVHANDIPYDRVEDRWIWAYFYRYLQSPPLRLLLSSLKRFHFSTLESRSRLTDEELSERIFCICPSATEQILYHHELIPRIAKGLMDAPYALTALEVLLPNAPFCDLEGWRWQPQDKSTLYTARPLHQLLCESPRLRHLKTLKMSYMTDFIDVHRRIEMFYIPPSLPPSPNNWGWDWGGEEQNNSDWGWGWGGEGQNNSSEEGEEEEEEESQDTLSLSRPGIWVCRDLETLHLEMHYHGEKGSIDTAVQMRIVCGYVSRVCPRLQDLQITLPEICMSRSMSAHGVIPFGLEAGLCLLSRLKYLERLRLEFSSRECEVAEVNWMCRYGRTEQHRERRREMVETWSSGKLKAEIVLEQSRKEDMRTVSATLDGTLLGARVWEDDELLNSLKNLGLLQDVVDMVEEMDTDKFVCLPALRRLAFGHHLEQSPEKELGSFMRDDVSIWKANNLRRLKRAKRLEKKKNK